MLDFTKTPKLRIEQSSKGYIILNSGSAMTFDENAPLTLKLSFLNEKGEQPFSFFIEFLFENRENEEHSVKVQENKDKQLVTITCINFNNAFGTGIVQPAIVAKYLSTDIYLRFWIYALGDNNVAKKIDYCFYQGKETNNDGEKKRK